MKEIPILFNGEMVRAILEGRKTQTRRPIKLPRSAQGLEPVPYECFADNGYLHVAYGAGDDRFFERLYPRFEVGDILWVRETFVLWGPQSYEYPSEGCDQWDGPPSRARDNGYDRSNVEYAADAKDIRLNNNELKWRPSIHMPRWASRIQLRVKSVRVQRVQDITEEDAFDEGMTRSLRLSLGYVAEASEEAFNFTQCRDTFRLLWNATYKNWDANPWVWAIEFERAEGEASHE